MMTDEKLATITTDLDTKYTCVPDNDDFDLSKIPCANFIYSAYIEVPEEQNALLVRLLSETDANGDKLFFFHGIFTDPATRNQFGVSTKSCPAELINFQQHNDNGVSDVRYRYGYRAKGVLAAVPYTVILKLDEIEGTPAWYRRERVDVRKVFDDITLQSCIKAQFYIMNEDLNETQRAKVRKAKNV